MTPIKIKVNNFGKFLFALLVVIYCFYIAFIHNYTIVHNLHMGTMAKLVFFLIFSSIYFAFIENTFNDFITQKCYTYFINDKKFFKKDFDAFTSNITEEIFDSTLFKNFEISVNYIESHGISFNVIGNLIDASQLSDMQMEISQKIRDKVKGTYDLAVLSILFKLNSKVYNGGTWDY